MIAGTLTSGRCATRGVLDRNSFTNAYMKSRCMRTLPCFAATSSAAVQLVDSLQPELTAARLQNVELSGSQQVLQVLKQYSGDTAAAASAAWTGLTHPLAVFGDAWLLNVLFLGSISLLAYALLVLAPRQ